MPDDELVDIASRGGLRAPATLERQIHRMLADPRSKELMHNFAGQWLHLRNMEVVSPDVAAFPEFDENLREALRRETELLLEDQLRRDRSVVEVLTADYSFLNERLARHYGIPNVYGGHFRRVILPGDSPRRGVLGHGSILTVSSYATRTSPVLRGKWVLENILDAPPPPPPPDVPGLPERDVSGQPTSVRERLEQHRQNPACAACHAQMDPIGFALENFDAVGRWRESEGGERIDASGTLPHGTKFEGVAGLRQILLDRREQFVTTVTTKMLTYALGRNVEYFDMPSVRKIVRDAAPDDYRWSSIIEGIVRSVPFQMGKLGT